jgi:hypothetical protein
MPVKSAVASFRLAPAAGDRQNTTFPLIGDGAMTENRSKRRSKPRTSLFSATEALRQAKAMKRAQHAILSALLGAFCGTVPADARDVHVAEVGSLRPIKCIVYNDGWFFTTTGPCSNFKAPSRIALGLTFSESDIEHRINVIVATQMESDYPEMSIKAGEWYCTAAEAEADLDEKGLKKRRTWLLFPSAYRFVDSFWLGDTK